MNKIDLIIDALQDTDSEWSYRKRGEALAAARELKALKPVGYIDKKGIMFNDTTHPHLHIALYALDEVTK
jgi:hypothetical protein